MKTALTITFVHLVCIVGCMLGMPTKKQAAKKPITIKTYHLQPTTQLASSPSPSPQITTPAKKNLPLPSSPQKEKVVTKKQTLKQETKNTPSANKKKELLQLAQAGLENLDNKKKPSPSSKNRALPQKLNSLESETIKYNEGCYEEELAASLQSQLTLPEKKTVLLRVSLFRNGTIKAIESIESSSKNNREYVEAALFNCALPPFGNHFKNEPFHSFSLTLISD